MSACSESAAGDGAVEDAVPAGAEQGPSGNDAADAAGFGGVTWADESADSAGPELASDEVDALADEGEVSLKGEASGEGTDDGDTASDIAPITVEDLVLDLERVSTERDQYLDASRRIQAEFENYKKAVAKRELEARERANESLVTEILPVLDACDGAVANGAADVEPVRAALVGALAKQGLERIDEEEAAFDPSRHDAVLHEPAENDEGPLVAEVMRAGYSWKGRVVRPAMVRVRG